MPTYGAAENGYHNLWDRAQLRERDVSAAKVAAERIIADKVEFEAVEKSTGVPWQWVGVVFLRESNLNMHGAFANGDPIIGTGRKTTHVPAGRGPFSTWAASAIDEINRRKLQFIGPNGWSVERMLFEAEAYNGWGYLGKCNSPYVWSWTTEYGPPESSGGKYVRDGVFNAGTVDTQPGVAAILKEMAKLDQPTEQLVAKRESTPPHPDVINGAVSNANAGRRHAAVGAGAAVTTGVASVTHTAIAKPVTPILETPMAVVMMGGGLTIAIVLVMLNIRTGNLLKARW